MILNYFIASRPWSFTVPVIGILLVSGLTHSIHHTPLLGGGCLKAMLLTALLQASGNLLNSYFDFTQGVDDQHTIGDRCIVDDKITPAGALTCSALLGFSAFWLIIPHLLAPERDFLYVFLASVLLAYFYTAPPFKLKYRGLGDVVIFLCFGPLMTAGSSILITGENHLWVQPYTIPVTLLTEAILHANNTRDIKQDAKSGIKTVAILLGYDKSRYLYLMMILGAYIGAVIMSVKFRGSLLVLFSVPLAVNTVKKFEKAKIADIDAETAKLHLVFGLLLNLGIKISAQQNVSN